MPDCEVRDELPVYPGERGGGHVEAIGLSLREGREGRNQLLREVYNQRQQSTVRPVSFVATEGPVAPAVQRRDASF